MSLQKNKKYFFCFFFSLVCATFIYAKKSFAQFTPLNYVCAPKTEQLLQSLEFEIKTEKSCQENEQWMQVHQKQSIWIFVPSEAPLSLEQEKDLKRLQDFWGGKQD